jgi:hypothetical protein
MSTEADIFSKLSRILETHSFDDRDPDFDLDELLNSQRQGQQDSFNTSSNYYQSRK